MTVKEKIMKIMALALEINPPEIEDIGGKRTAVFVHWYPHCNYLCVDIYLGRWRSEQGADKTFRVHTDFDDNLDSIIAELERIKADLPGGDESDE